MRTQAFTLPERASAALVRILAAFEGAQEAFNSCFLFGIIPGVVFDNVGAQELVEGLVEGVTEDLLGIGDSGLDELAARVSVVLTSSC